MGDDGLFSERAKRVLRFANEEAKRWNHLYIGTEHILLGLTRDTDCFASIVLRAFGISGDQVRFEVERLLDPLPETVTSSKLPQTPRAKKVIESAMEEAWALNHCPVGTEHILLGLLREKDGVACMVLSQLTLTFDKARCYVHLSLGTERESSSRSPGEYEPPPELDTP